MFVDHVGSTGTVTVYVANGNWTESAVNGTNAPAPGATVANNVMVSSTDSYLTVDATAAVQNWVAGITPNSGFLILSAAGANVQFDSKARQVRQALPVRPDSVGRASTLRSSLNPGAQRPSPRK